MGVVTNRILRTTVEVNNSIPTILWGSGTSGYLKGGTMVTATITVPVEASPNNLVVTIWVRSTIDAEWVAYSDIVTCPHSESTKIDFLDVIGHSIKLTGVLDGGGPYDVEISGLVMG